MFDASSPDASGSGNKKGWSGFNLLSWRGFMGRSKRESTDSSTSSRAPDDQDDNGVEDDDYPLPVPDNDDDYAFSSTSSDEGDEPWGLYRAAFRFEAVGEHEIGLEEGDLVEVRGRGGGEGWVVAISRKRSVGEVGKRELGESAGMAKEGLVPESYLEKVQENGHHAGEDEATESA